MTSAQQITDDSPAAALIRPAITYATLLERGATAQVAYQQVARELSRARHRQTVAALAAYPSGREALERATAEWAERGWLPPWQESVHP